MPLAAQNPPADDPAAEEAVDEEDEKLPQLKDMELPDFTRLMQGPAQDWLVLKTNKVIVVEPVTPRPGTLDDIAQRVARSARKSSDPPETEEAKRRRLNLGYLQVTLPDNQDQPYRLSAKLIKEIVYYEDLMLRRIDQLLDEKKIRQAYELILALEERQDSWPGIAPRKDRLMFLEAEVRLAAGQEQHALALLESLHERRANYQGLEAQFGEVGERLMSQAFADSDFRRVRYFLKRISRRYSGHKVVKDWTAKLTGITRDLVNQAVAAERSGQLAEALNIAEQATRYWPELPELLPVYNRLAQRLQRLRVGVVELPEPVPPQAPVILNHGEQRRRQLTQSPLFEPARLEGKIVRYESRYFTDWEPTELGHSVVFRLRPYRVPGESQPMFTAAGLAWSLGRRHSPHSAAYDARFGATVESLDVRSPFELAVRFQQVPLRPEALFAFTPPPTDRTSDQEAGPLHARPSDSPPAITYPFQFQSVDENRVVYRRTIPDLENTTDHRISEVIEVKFDTYARAVQSLLRGDVSLLPRVPAYAIRGLTQRQEFFSQSYALPTTHVLQFNPHNRVLAARTLRRALVYAINRPQILEDVFLHETPGALGRVTSAPFASTSYAYSADGARKVEPHKFDPALAFSLAKTAEKELGGQKIPQLRLVCGSDPEIQAAAQRILANWKLAGIDATLRVAPAAGIALPGQAAAGVTQPGLEDWDIVYRTDVLPEPIVDLWSYLALTNSTETASLGHLPTWLRKQLLELDRVGDFSSATELLHHFHELFWAEVHLIPLWEIDDLLVYRKQIRGVPERPVSTYQKIERWKVEPWYPRESPL
ncbi:MAG: hypothetical protein JSS02_29915 [Planctomycetes bacterium]|nr:hypothetical protein [Planctomycetota bacterium]